MALGSRKYPSENLYKFTAGKNGGKTNAFTANESTAYQFGDNSNINNNYCIFFISESEIMIILQDYFLFYPAFSSQ